MNNDIYADLTMQGLAEIACELEVEISVVFTKEEKTISIQPWRPFEYKCPFGTESVKK